jgi:hypothetical protein
MLGIFPECLKSPLSPHAPFKATWCVHVASIGQFPPRGRDFRPMFFPVAFFHTYAAIRQNQRPNCCVIAQALSIRSYVEPGIDVLSLWFWVLLRQSPRKTQNLKINRTFSGGKKETRGDIHTYSELCCRELSIPILISPGSSLYREILAILRVETERGKSKANVDLSLILQPIVSFLLSRIFRYNILHINGLEMFQKLQKS